MTEEAVKEREVIVGWLREKVRLLNESADHLSDRDRGYANALWNASCEIERGDHLA
jgi:hypothetical protein